MQFRLGRRNVVLSGASERVDTRETAVEESLASLNSNRTGLDGNERNFFSSQWYGLCTIPFHSAPDQTPDRLKRHHPREPARSQQALLINQAYENMGLRTTQMLGTFFDGIARHTEEALQWAEDINQRGLRHIIAHRDRSWQGYGQQP